MAPVASSFAFGHAKPTLRRPRLDDQQRRLRVQPGEDDLGNVGMKQTPSGLRRRSARPEPPARRPLPRPATRPPYRPRVKRRTMQGEPQIPPQIRTLARPRHRPEPELAVGELALDARDPWGAVGPQRRDRLVPARLEEPRTRAANSGSACSTSFHAAIAAVCARSLWGRPFFALSRLRYLRGHGTPRRMRDVDACPVARPLPARIAVTA